MKNIYAWCGTRHKPEEEHRVANHMIVAYEEDVENLHRPIGTWVSSNHSFGKDDIVYSIKKTLGEQPFNLIWIDDVHSHPWSQKFWAKAETPQDTELLKY